MTRRAVSAAGAVALAAAASVGAALAFVDGERADPTNRQAEVRPTED